jgi:hypothetical protein
VTTRVSVRKADGTWGGYTDALGNLTAYGLPLKWWTGSVWQLVTHYNHVWRWNGKVWIPFDASKSLAQVGSAVETAGAAGIKSITTPASTVPVQLVVSVGSYAADDVGPLGSTIGPGPGFAWSTPGWSYTSGQYGNGGTGYVPATAGFSESTVTQPVDQVRVFSTVDTVGALATPVDAFRWPFQGTAVDTTANAHRSTAKLAASGVSRMGAALWVNGRSSDPTKMLTPGTAALAADSMVVYVLAMWNRTPGTTVPGAVTPPAGFTQAWTDTWTATSTSTGYSMRCYVWYGTAAAGSALAENVLTGSNVDEYLCGLLVFS